MDSRKNEVVGSSYGLSSSGWVDSKGWLVDHFLENCVSARLLLMLLDGHSSHYQPDLIKYAHKIIRLFCSAYHPHYS